MNKNILNGLTIVHRRKTAFIPLPIELWVEIDGGCSCATCLSRGLAPLPGRRSVPAWWDTLAIGSSSTTWTVHAPDLHQTYSQDELSKWTPKV